MKFDVMERDVETSQSISTKKITLSANAKAFKIIFGQIYPDIIKAIVRELFTNAWDSQKVANNLDTPIDIHLPTKWEPYFSIRDYGTGMTPEIIDSVYSNVFESTKDDSNEEAGMFGMGSKTPLGYTDSFTIISYVDGLMYVYDNYIDNNGEPVIDCKVISETEEPNGVLVSLGVKEEDYNQFKNYAEVFAINAGTPININRTRVLNHREIHYSGSNWELYDSYDSSYIRMGCVIYKIDLDLLLRDFDRYSWERRHYLRILNNPFIINFDIGTFEVTGSREDIIYNNDSIKTILETLDNINVELTNIIQNDINNCKGISEAITYSFKYQGLPNITGLKYKSWGMTEILFNLSAEKMGLKDRISVNTHKKYKSCRWSRAEMIDNDLYKSDRLTYVVIDDKQKNRIATNRIKHLIKNIKDNIDILWVKTYDDVSLKRIFTILPKNHIVININDILPLPKAPRKELVNVQKSNDSTYRLATNNLNKLSFSTYHKNIKSELYYVRAVGRKITNQEEVIKAVDILGINRGDVVVITKKYEEFISLYNLKCLLEEAKKVSEDIIYNDETLYYNTIKTVLNEEYRWMLPWNYEYSLRNGKIEILKLFGWNPEVLFDAEKIDNKFVHDANQETIDKCNKIKEIGLNNIKKIIDNNPLFLYIKNSFQTYHEEILKLVGDKDSE